MKQLLLLTILLSCSPKGAAVKTATPPVAEEKREQHLQKPELAPQGCACIKIFRPVCAEGRTFGNSCEAQCHGFKKWSEGPCK